MCLPLLILLASSSPGPEPDENMSARGGLYLSAGLGVGFGLTEGEAELGGGLDIATRISVGQQIDSSLGVGLVVHLLQLDRDGFSGFGGGLGLEGRWSPFSGLGLDLTLGAAFMALSLERGDEAARSEDDPEGGVAGRLHVSLGWELPLLRDWSLGIRPYVEAFVLPGTDLLGGGVVGGLELRWTL